VGRNTIYQILSRIRAGSGAEARAREQDLSA
jgi:hypothetical protein